MTAVFLSWYFFFFFLGIAAGKEEHKNSAFLSKPKICLFLRLGLSHILWADWYMILWDSLKWVVFYIRVTEAQVSNEFTKMKADITLHDKTRQLEFKLAWH